MIVISLIELYEKQEQKTKQKFQINTYHKAKILLQSQTMKMVW